MSAKTYSKCPYRCAATSPGSVAPPQSTVKRSPNHRQIATKPPQTTTRITRKRSLNAQNHIRNAPKTTFGAPILALQAQIGAGSSPFGVLDIRPRRHRLNPSKSDLNFGCEDAFPSPVPALPPTSRGDRICRLGESRTRIPMFVESGSTDKKADSRPENPPDMQEAGLAVAGNPNIEKATHGKRSTRHSGIRS